MSLTKEQALEKIDELKSFVATCDKKETKKTTIQIKNRFTGDIIYKSEKSTLKEAVVEAKKEGADLSDADLRDADLSGANLSGADLSGANLSGAELASAKFYGKTDNPKTLTEYQVPEFLKALGFKIEN